MKKRKCILGIPLKAEFGDPVGAPEWYHRLLNAVLDICMALILLDVYLFFELTSQLDQASSLAWAR